MKHKSNIFYILVMILLTFAFIGCNGSNSTKTSKAKTDKLFNENNITSLKIYDIMGEPKDIKSDADIKTVVALINSVKILQSGIEPKLGIGFTVEITYADGKREGLIFLSTSMQHNGKVYSIDKDIVDELRKLYNKN